jgi:hypothetical protein
MMRIVLIAAAAQIVAVVPALSQPGVTPSPEPAPQVAPAPPLAQPAPIQMSARERDLILRGEIPVGRAIGGAIVGMFVPFGIGQTVQGRWTERGWIFTAGELGSIGLVIYGVSACSESDNCGALVGGIIGLVGFRIWEIVDAWVAPALHNQRVREVRAKYGITPEMVPYEARWTPFVVPAAGGGFAGGVSWTF